MFRKNFGKKFNGKMLQEKNEMCKQASKHFFFGIFSLIASSESFVECVREDHCTPGRTVFGVKTHFYLFFVYLLFGELGTRFLL